ncbi:winged helix-turn-helix domain-containing protein [Streptomyces lacrimifluminis]|uniref:Transcriptional regulator n=1 Tax=Streptomyces lacrimifluminis TaxID=1500077 RepID=A0A917KMT2_9ACTN|nr:transcriptional regulator [Streptomyces lacrimifluminis]GGJ19469.1 transcriptional regulator [Streptomyces lacrimifluminis]
MPTTGTRKPGRASGLAASAGLMADGTRAGFLLALLDGRAWTAGGLLAEKRQGRHRYVRLADAGVAQLVEELAAHAGPAAAERPRTLRESGAGSAMARGPTCDDHLAGRLGTALTDALTGRELLRQDTGFALTDAGLRWFATAGIDLDRTGRRPLARACLDWTERRPHLAGTAGAALCRHALDARWCVRIGSERAVRVTPEGEHRFAQLLGIEATDLR